MKKLLLIAAFLLSTCKPYNHKTHGYVEGEFVMIAPTSSGILKSLDVERGQQISVGQKLFSLDLVSLEAARSTAEAELLRARAEWDDLTKGKRPEEIAVILKQKERAEAEYINAKKDYERIKKLTKTKIASQASLDDSKAAFDAAKAHLDEIVATLKASTLGEREDRVKAAKAAIDIAVNGLAQAEKRLHEAAPVSIYSAYVEDTFFRPGEFVNIGNPVVSILPPENVKIRFFMSQAVIPSVALGQVVNISCDGCEEAIPAKVTFISDKAEYTPPVIYSVESRDKLVFMIEAKPDRPNKILKPGLPVDIELVQ